MQKKVLIVFAVLIAASAFQTAAASERGHARKMVRPAAASAQFRNANNAMVWTSQPNGYSGYDEALSAPAGR